MKQKSKQRKRKHTQATQKAYYKNSDISTQYHTRFSSSKKATKISELNGTLGRSQHYRLGDRRDKTA